MSKPRCHRCGTHGYLNGIKITPTKVHKHKKTEVTYYNSTAIDNWEYCVCPAGTDIKHQHTLMQTLLPQGVSLVPPIRHGQKAKTSVNELPYNYERTYINDQQYIPQYRAGKSMHGLGFSKAFKFTDIFYDLAIPGKSAMLVSYDEATHDDITDALTFTILDPNLRTP